MFEAHPGCRPKIDGVSWYYLDKGTKEVNEWEELTMRTRLDRQVNAHPYEQCRYSKTSPPHQRDLPPKDE